jgi:hypothetical protein
LIVIWTDGLIARLFDGYFSCILKFLQIGWPDKPITQWLDGLMAMSLAIRGFKKMAGLLKIKTSHLTI